VPLASLDDVNVFLADDKLQALDADDNASQLDAERIIKGKLSGTYSPVVLASWTTPVTTPEYIRAVAGRLIAALYYARAYSEETPAVPAYAQGLYDQAMAMLCKVVEGFVILPEVPTSEQPSIGGRLDSTDFLPNGDTIGPVFTMTEVWG
jgi:hypothetical protein